MSNVNMSTETLTEILKALVIAKDQMPKEHKLSNDFVQAQIDELIAILEA